MHQLHQITTLQILCLVGAGALAIAMYPVARPALENYVNGDHAMSRFESSYMATLTAGIMVLLALGTPFAHWPAGGIVLGVVGSLLACIGCVKFASHLQQAGFDQPFPWLRATADMTVFGLGIGIAALATLV